MKKTKGTCCHCGRPRILNSRLLCNVCSDSPSTFPKKHFKINTYKSCSICNYVFPDDDEITCNVCCACCPERLKKRCSKEIKMGRKSISLKISSRTKQTDINDISDTGSVKEIDTSTKTPNIDYVEIDENMFA